MVTPRAKEFQLINVDLYHIIIVYTTPLAQNINCTKPLEIDIIFTLYDFYGSVKSNWSVKVRIQRTRVPNSFHV